MKRTTVLAGIALVAFGALAVAAPNATRAIPARTVVRFIAPPLGDIAPVEESCTSIYA